MSDPRLERVHPWVAPQDEGLRFGIFGSPPGGWEVLRDFVQMVEDLGFDSYWLGDHPLLGANCWTNLAAAATSTSRLRLGSLVSCVYYSQPAVLARVVADVDRLSGGRVVLGLGAGDMEPEFRAMGLGWPSVSERLAALAEAVQIIPPLLRGETVHYAGKHFQVNGATLALPAVQQPHVPLVVPGGGPTTLRLVAQHADVSNMVAAEWGGNAVTAEDVRRKYDLLQEQCAALGRSAASVLRTHLFVPTILAESPGAVEVKRSQLSPLMVRFAGQAALVGTPEQAVERLRPLAAVGCTYFIFNARDTDTLRLLADRVVPALAVPV